MSQPIGSVCCNADVNLHNLIDADGKYAGDLFQCFECESYSLECRN